MDRYPDSKNQDAPSTLPERQEQSYTPTILQSSDSVFIPADLAPNAWILSPPAPWRRWAARLLDMVVSGVFGFFLIAVAWFMIAPVSADAFFSSFNQPGSFYFNFLVSTLVALFINALFIGVTGFTLGKYIFGIQVTLPDGRVPGIGNAFLREVMVFIKGLGLSIPIITLITMGFSYERLVKYGTTSWDANRFIIHYRPPGLSQILFNVLGVVLILLSRVIIVVLNR